MKLILKVQEQGKGIVNTVSRFPITMLFLLLTAIWNIMAINNQSFESYNKLMLSFVLGASIYVVLQMVYERFFSTPIARGAFMAVPFVLALIYYLMIKDQEFDVKIGVRTIVLFFILFIAFLWVPVIKSRINFNQSFMAAFKAFFMAVLFSGVLFVGILLILGATDRLILDVSDKAYAHAANIIFVLLFPIYFLSMIPTYSQEESEEDNIGRELLARQIAPARFLEVLISYVAIPIAAVFTVILLLYIIMNIRGEFWTDNLMEPLLVSYSIIAIIVYLLASTITNAVARYFRLIFPKVLLLVVLFQTISSLLRIREDGISYGRYYVILFGVFAIIASLWFCIKPVQSNGIIAPVLIILSLFSILPFVNAFTVSRVSQTNRLVTVLERNDMLADGRIVPKSDISREDMKAIQSSVQYLSRLEYTKEISWLREYYTSNNFEKTFGFSEYTIDDPGTVSNYVTITRKQSSPIPISGYDYLTRFNVYDKNMESTLGSFEMDGKTYSLSMVRTSSEQQEILLKSEEQEMIRFPFSKIYTEFEGSSGNKELDTSELIFTMENEKAAITVVPESININSWKDGESRQADVNILVKLK